MNSNRNNVAKIVTAASSTVLLSFSPSYRLNDVENDFPVMENLRDGLRSNIWSCDAATTAILNSWKNYILAPLKGNVFIRLKDKAVELADRSFWSRVLCRGIGKKTGTKVANDGHQVFDSLQALQSDPQPKEEQKDHSITKKIIDGVALFNKSRLGRWSTDFVHRWSPVVAQKVLIPAVVEFFLLKLRCFGTAEA